ncbi:ATP-dependent DNA helicase chl1 [Savitreella phatthalungensis]
MSKAVEAVKEQVSVAKSKAEQLAQETPLKRSGIDLYSRFALAGAISCSVTHGALTPVDVVKTRIQLEPEVYNKGMITGFRQVVSKEGAGALLTGFGPTAAGYFLQGMFKFGGYELFKKLIIDQIGVETATQNRTAVYLGASAIAEFFADVALCPLEATRIRLVSQPSFANGLVGGASRIFREEGIGAFYAGFGPILFKQVPYTMAKFVVFERASEVIFGQFGGKDKVSPGTATALNLASGLVAGTAAAIISQPADTLLSKVNKVKKAPGQSTSSLLVQLAKQTGIGGLFSGLGARIVMVGTLTSGQFGIYGDLKKYLDVATSGVELAK